MRLALLPIAIALATPIYNRSRIIGNIKKFRIAVPSDLHFGELPLTYGPIQDTESALLLRSMLREERPDLVILNGDLITGEDVQAESATSSLEILFQPMVEANVPWASTYGNHDSKYNLTREAIFAVEQTYDLSMTRHGPPDIDGLTNYYIPLHVAGAPAIILWFFDSRGGSDVRSNVDNIPNWVSSKTATWFLDTSASLTGRFGALHHLVFVHIPPLPFFDSQRRYFKDGSDAGQVFPGLNEDVPMAVQSESALNNSTYDGHDQPFIDALLARRVHSVWSGHDHGNSWCSKWTDETADASDGVVVEQSYRKPFLCFCKHSGSGGYGPWQRGIRMIDLHYVDGRMEVDTWVRMDDRSVINKVSLNETYGRDKYPPFDTAAHGSEFFSRLKKTQEGNAVLSK
ncbi:Putative uncharacterized protein [Taphrina deformans PYCC 5710]|uniref:Calcineurin-like phosphoesterase domain-containing protein n=1 Tax=Taphrina deformans (strain PYCC 5710 / ATCC 11124 / CBS 356.35 / IMI 108563 / JCM 9778 / NBRC 8474) TaxID=1097556 RepID=R4X6M5_TAPDE|nr:Putative uncharacterized protein [Taphrina deformans PYCC 5710]|eukprot:CCG80526.1 Putative uncharacterized protein [Taphrina deformans PYCC 5710]